MELIAKEFKVSNTVAKKMLSAMYTARRIVKPKKFIPPADTWDEVAGEVKTLDQLKPSPHINNITYPYVCECVKNNKEQVNGK